MSNEPRCPKCGGPLVKRKFVDEWPKDNRPVAVWEDWYCPSCKASVAGIQ
jgi:ribosomal protein L37AE/L43A